MLEKVSYTEKVEVVYVYRKGKRTISAKRLGEGVDHDLHSIENSKGNTNYDIWYRKTNKLI